MSRRVDPGARAGMHRFAVAAALIGIAILAPVDAQAQMGSAMCMGGGTCTPREWMEAAKLKAGERLEGVDIYVERIKGGEIPGLRAALGPGQSSACLSDCRVHTTVDVPLPDGSPLKAPHLLSPGEVAVLAGQSPTAATMDLFAGGYGAMQDMFAGNADQMTGPFAGMARAAFGDISVSNAEVRADIESKSWEGNSPSPGAGLQSSEREAPWLNPFRMFGAGSYMFEETADAVAEAERGLGKSAEEALADAERRRALLADAEIVGIEDVGGVRAVHIALPTGSPPGVSENFDGQNFVPTGAAVWIDTEKLTYLKHRVDGTMTADGQTRNVFIESERSDFRDVAGSDMYEPYKRVMRMGGMLDEAQMAEMEKARAQLAEFDRQMASMPASQRAMVENMMGGQMDAVRNMSQSGTIEYVEIISEILVNPDLKALYATGASGAGIMSAGSTGLSLLERIQTDLKTLGYQPGNTDGVADTMTTVAISQFQAEHKLEVTGEPSEALAASLAALVAP